MQTWFWFCVVMGIFAAALTQPLVSFALLIMDALASFPGMPVLSLAVLLVPAPLFALQLAGSPL